MKAIVFNLSMEPIKVHEIVRADEYQIIGPFGPTFDLVPMITAQRTVREHMETFSWSIQDRLNTIAYIIVELSPARVACAYMVAMAFQIINIKTSFWFVTKKRNEFIAIDEFFIEAYDWAMSFEKLKSTKLNSELGEIKGVTITKDEEK